MNKVKLISVSIIVGSFLIIVSSLVATCYSMNNANAIGEGIGQEMGTFAGVACGSFDGITKGIGEGESAGTIKGLSAEETTAKLANEIKEVGRLRVLDMNVTLTDVFSVGAEDKPDSSTGYFALLTFEGTASYTVDLEQCVISEENDVIKITIPRPDLRVTIDLEKTRKRAEDNASQFTNGSSVNGYVGFINSLKASNEKVKESLAGYDALKETADKRAISAVKRLAETVRLDDKNIEVEFAAESVDKTIEVVEEGVNT